MFFCRTVPRNVGQLASMGAWYQNLVFQVYLVGGLYTPCSEVKGKLDQQEKQCVILCQYYIVTKEE